MKNKFKGQALNFNVVVEEVLNENITASGIDLSGIVDANEKQKKGRVVSIGESCPRENYTLFSRFWLINFFLQKRSHTIQVNDIIIFDKLKMDTFTQNGNPYLIIKYSDIVLVL